MAAANPGVTFVGVAAHSDVGAMQSFVSKYHLNFTNLNDADGSIWARYNVPWQPAWVFYNSDGAVRVREQPHFGDVSAGVGRPGDRADPH